MSRALFVVYVFILQTDFYKRVLQLKNIRFSVAKKEVGSLKLTASDSLIRFSSVPWSIVSGLLEKVYNSHNSKSLKVYHHKKYKYCIFRPTWPNYDKKMRHKLITTRTPFKLFFVWSRGKKSFLSCKYCMWVNSYKRHWCYTSSYNLIMMLQMSGEVRWGWTFFIPSSPFSYSYTYFIPLTVHNCMQCTYMYVWI